MNPAASNNSTPISSSPSYWVIVPAAGMGARMNAAISKQYLMLGDKTVLEQTLQRLLKIPRLAGIVVAIAPDDSTWTTLQISKHPLLHVTCGGAERADSVLNGLHFLQNKLQPQDWVMVHDAARPCVSLQDIETLCTQLREDAVGGILAAPVSDTLKNVNQQNEISQTVDRRALWQAQTPQLFRYKLLRDCLLQAVADKKIITDEASAVELYGFIAKVVEAKHYNIKITRPNDLPLAELIMQHIQEQENDL